MDLDRDLIGRTKGFLDPEEGRRLYEAALGASLQGPLVSRRATPVSPSSQATLRQRRRRRTTRPS